MQPGTAWFQSGWWVAKRWGAVSAAGRKVGKWQLHQRWRGGKWQWAGAQGQLDGNVGPMLVSWGQVQLEQREECRAQTGRGCMEPGWAAPVGRGPEPTWATHCCCLTLSPHDNGMGPALPPTAAATAISPFSALPPLLLPTTPPTHWPLWHHTVPCCITRPQDTGRASSAPMIPSCQSGQVGSCCILQTQPGSWESCGARVAGEGRGWGGGNDREVVAAGRRAYAVAPKPGAAEALSLRWKQHW